MTETAVKKPRQARGRMSARKKMDLVLETFRLNFSQKPFELKMLTNPFTPPDPSARTNAC